MIQRFLGTGMVMLLVVCCGTGFAKNLHTAFSKTEKIKFYLAGVTSSGNTADIDVPVFMEAFITAARERINMKFVPVTNKAEADVVITAKVTAYEYKEKVMPRFYSAYAFVADMSAPKNYAKIRVDYVIADPSDAVLMRFKHFTTEERLPREDADEKEAFARVARKNADRLLYRAFYEEKG